MNKKVMYKTIISIILLTLVITTGGAFALPSNISEESMDIQEYVKAMQPGWNLGNTFDATGDETSWGNPRTTKALIDAIAAQGYKSIRIPITWDHRIGSAPNYTINSEFLLRIQEVVDWSLDAGLYVMINMHHDSWLWLINMKTQHNEILARYNSVWQQIADFFKDYPNMLMFESINEPTFSHGWSSEVNPVDLSLLDELNTSFYNIVRNSGGNNATRPLVLPTLSCSPTEPEVGALANTIAKLNDDNIIATVHYYGYWPFSVNIAGTTTFDEVTKNDLEDAINRIYNTFTANGIPVVIGEYGLLGFDRSLYTVQHGEMLKYFEYLKYYATQKDITLMLWDNGQHFDRYSFTWRDQDLYNTLMTDLNERSSYTERDFIYIKKGAPIQDVDMKFYFNGNTLVNIICGNRFLEEGIDYSILGDTLILKSALIEELLTGEYGINAVLTCKFSRGADWKLNIIYYDTPILRNSTGTTSNFFIPTDFNGDSLATMEAMYVNGGNAGPQDWTSFKEFDYVFSPLYELNQIKITEDFFNETRDGDILLKMHFWSGNILEYKITKNGSQVIGTSLDVPPDITQPVAPTSLKATILDISSIKLEWSRNAESDIVGYRVYRSTTSNFTPSNSNFIKQVTANTYTDTGLNPNTTYYYKITAVNTSGNESEPSNQVSATTFSDTEPPPDEPEDPGVPEDPGHDAEYTIISLPFSYDGAGEFYWKTNKFSTDTNDWTRCINSWNIEILEINGVDYTNMWSAQHQIPPFSDGYWYIHYKASVPWAHVEIK